MDTSGWLATVSAGIAALAFIVSLRALQLQRAGAEASTRQEFDELVRQLWLALVKSLRNVEDSRPGSNGFSPGAEEATGEMQTLALRADEILHPAVEDNTRHALASAAVNLWAWTNRMQAFTTRDQLARPKPGSAPMPGCHDYLD